MLYISTMKQHKSIKIDAGLINKVDQQAKKENRSFNNMVETILSDYYNEDGYMTTNQGDKIKIDLTK